MNKSLSKREKKNMKKMEKIKEGLLKTPESAKKN